MRKLLSFIILIAGLRAGAQQNYWQQELHYIIDVSLNDTENTIDGFLKLRYINHSPDTLHFIWFHLWPNAYKNVRTAYSEQLLQNGSTDFYFSDKEQRGYINRLDFRIGNTSLKTEDHPLYIDVLKVLLSTPLAPGAETEITTPFHVKLPYNFSRGGHIGKSYQVTQWYPKPAVYDSKGWHPMPYLDQGEFYGEFASYDVRITIPQNYIVAATGELQNEEEKRWLNQGAVSQTGAAIQGPGKGGRDTLQPIDINAPPASKPKKGKFVTHKQMMANKQTAKKAVTPTPAPIVVKPPVINSIQPKTLRYVQDRVHDFAWFASKDFIVQHDTIQLASGRIIDAYSYYSQKDVKDWVYSIQYIKDAIHFRSAVIAEYPYDIVSVVEAKMGVGNGGMEYPTITNITPSLDGKDLDLTIEHEIGHNWFYGILGSNERDYPWMDEGINTYYDMRYEALKYPKVTYSPWLKKRVPDNFEKFGIDAEAKEKKDQPVSTPSVEFTELNYNLVAYYKTGFTLQKMQQYIGQEQFDSCMRAYYRQWQFKHPQPEDYEAVIEKNAGKDLSPYFKSMQEKGSVTDLNGPKKIKPVFLFSFNDYQHYTYVNILPALAYNKYDKQMLGLVVHNYNLPSNKFRFVLIPLYSFNSKQVNGTARLSYSWYPSTNFKKIEAAISGNRYSSLQGIDSTGGKVFGGYYRVVPSLRFTFSNKTARSSLEKWIEWKTFLIGERGFNYFMKSTDSLYYPSLAKTETRYVNQLTLNITDYRVLYPYDLQLQVQQGDGWYRANATGNYFFNYSHGGGMHARVFAAKFGYLGEKTIEKQFATEIYQPKLTAVRGNEDYTYSNYFIGRNESNGFNSQQIMMRDGGLKLRTDLFQGLQGRSDNWVASMNLNTTLPNRLFPFKLPLRIFLDVGTYADAWQKNAATSRFLYVGGFQITLLKDLVNIYLPIVYSKEFSDNLKTVPEENKFLKKISFSIDIQRFNLRKFTDNKIPF
jgi:hypothetical protein